MSEHDLSTIEAIGKIFADFGDTSDPHLYSYTPDPRVEGTLDVYKSAVIGTLQDNILGSGDKIYGIVLRASVSNAPSTLDRALAAIFQNPEPRLGVARIKVLGTPHTNICTDPLTYDKTLQDISYINSFPLFIYDALDPLCNGLVPGAYVHGNFDSNTWRRGRITSVDASREPFNPGAPAKDTKNKNFEARGAQVILAPQPENATDPAMYDMEPEIPQKSQHAEILVSLQPDFRNKVKGFLYDAWKEKNASIRLNSGYRSEERQQELYNEWVVGGRQGVQPAAGFSYHNLGMAIDFNPTINGRTLMKTDKYSTWVESGIVALGEKNGLYWGGRFSTNYDPIHFDFRRTLPRSKRKSHMLAAAAGLLPNQAPV